MDRLINSEAASTNHNISKNWLLLSTEKERLSEKCISGLELDERFCDGHAISKGKLQTDLSSSLKFRRNLNSTLRTHLSDLKFEIECQAFVSVDTTIF